MTQLDHHPTSVAPLVPQGELHRAAPEGARAVGHFNFEALPDFHHSRGFATDLASEMGDRFLLEDQFKMLASVLEGRVVTPEQADYDAVRSIVPGNYDPRPKAVIRVANASDVAASLDFARITGLEVAVRSGGHSGHSSTHTGLVIDLRDLNGLEIDSIGRDRVGRYRPHRGRGDVRR